MKKILLIILVLITSVSFGQKRTEGDPIVDYVSKKIGLHVTFLEYEQKKDSYRVLGINYYDSIKECYVKINKSEIKKKYPDLLDWFTIKVNLPLRRTDRTNVDNLNVIDTIDLRDRP